MHRPRVGSLCVLILALAAPLALAQTTGSVSGVVRDTGGAPLPGATVSIAGPPMPLGRTATSRSDGTFQFLNLIPGNYQLRAELQGLFVVLLGLIEVVRRGVDPPQIIESKE